MDNTSFLTLSDIWVAAMGKSKRAKDLTHEEIWDDSALVRSWDDAVEEYQVRPVKISSRDRYLMLMVALPQHPSKGRKC
jgi:hypothetical protein